MSIVSGSSRAGTATGATPVRLIRSSSSLSDRRRLAVLIARTQSSISSCDEALARKVRLAVTMPKEKECFLIVTGATVCTDLRSRTRLREYSWCQGEALL